MAAPSGITWGNEVTGSASTRKGKIGIYASTSNTTTATNVSVEVWFWSYYSVSDTTNTFYADWNSDCSTNHGSLTVKTTNASGNGYSTTNQILLASYSNTYSRGRSASTQYFSAKLTGIDVLNSSNVMSHSVSFTVPALPSYTVTFNANGGTSGSTTAVPVTYSCSDYYSYGGIVPSRTGYTFTGFYTAPSGGVQVYGNNGVCINGTGYWSNNTWCYAGNVTLYAHWSANTYTILFNANNGTTGTSSKTVTYNSTYGTLPTATRAGYTFKGWYTAVSGGTQITSSSTVTITSNTTLYAQWKPANIAYYNKNGNWLLCNSYVKNNGTWKPAIMKNIDKE